MASTLEEAKKFLEGWTSYKSEQAKGSKKCWMVLRGATIFLFSSDKPNKEMLGSLILGPGTCMTDMKSKREFKFELSATNRKGQPQKGVFKFNKESDYHLWKAYIVAIATGSIPPDARLLPGQQSDVYEAMVEVRKRNPRPGTGTGTGTASSSRRQTALPSQPPQNQPSSSSSSGGRLDAEDNADYVYDYEDDPAIRQLTKRLEELAEREINDRDLQTASVSSWPINEILETMRPKEAASAARSVVATADATVASAPTTTTTMNSSSNRNSTTVQSKRTSFQFANHAFYSDGIRSNSVTPSWFVNCSRDQAEEILASDGFGTVLMRASSGFPINGNYVISFRREIQGKVAVCHYNILRTEDGFKIDVENKHSPMQSLSAVMDFFSSFAGKSAKPLTSNNLTELLGKYQAEAFPPVVEKETVHRRSIGSSSAHSHDSFHSQPPTMTSQSSRSSFAEGQSGPSPPRNSRGSFVDFPVGAVGGGRRPSDAHSHRLPFQADDRRNSSASSSSVFYHQNHVTEAIGGSPPPAPSSSYGGGGGSFTGSVNGSGIIKDLYSANRSVSIEEAAAPSIDADDQIYSNQSETIASPDNNNGVSSRSTLGSSSSSSVGHKIHGFDRAGSLSQPQPPAPPPKPGPQEIYQLMKPPPPSAEGGEYSSSAGSEIIYGASNGVDLETPTSVKELARMLQCSLEK